MKFVTLILALLIPQIALARIGETLEQCEKRYGKPVEVISEQVRRYEKKGVEILIMVWKGKVHYIRYDGGWASSKQPLTKPFTWELLKKNFPDRTGSEIENLYDKEDYKWKEHLKKAGYEITTWSSSTLSGGRGGYLQVCTKEFRDSGDFLKQQKMKHQADAKILIEGF